MTAAARKQREPEDNDGALSARSGSSSLSVAAVVILGVSSSAATERPRASQRPEALKAMIAGEHGGDKFLVRIDELGLAQAAGAPVGDSEESVLIGGGRAFRVSVCWLDTENDPEDVAKWKAVSELANARRFCDCEGDLDPELAHIPSDAWQLAYGKIVAPLPAEDNGDDDGGSASSRGTRRERDAS